MSWGFQNGKTLYCSLKNNKVTPYFVENMKILKFLILTTLSYPQLQSKLIFAHFWGIQTLFWPSVRMSHYCEITYILTECPCTLWFLSHVTLLLWRAIYQCTFYLTPPPHCSSIITLITPRDPPVPSIYNNEWSPCWQLTEHWIPDPHNTTNNMMQV